MWQQVASGSFGEVQTQIDQIINDMLGRHFTRFCPVSAWQPAVNLYETPTALLVCVDLAGMKKDDFDLSVQENMLIIRGRRPGPRPAGEPVDLRVHLMEINSGDFYREVEIPSAVRQDEISASYGDGLLWITLPKEGST